MKIGKLVIMSSYEAELKNRILREQAELIEAQNSYISSLEDFKDALCDKILELEVTNKTMIELQKHKEN